MIGMIFEPRKRDGCGVRNIFLTPQLWTGNSSRSSQFYMEAIKIIGPISFSTYGSKNLRLWVYLQDTYVLMSRRDWLHRTRLNTNLVPGEGNHALKEQPPYFDGGKTRVEAYHSETDLLTRSSQFGSANILSKSASHLLLAMSS